MDSYGYCIAYLAPTEETELFPPRFTLYGSRPRSGRVVVGAAIRTSTADMNYVRVQDENWHHQNPGLENQFRREIYVARSGTGGGVRFVLLYYYRTEPLLSTTCSFLA